MQHEAVFETKPQIPVQEGSKHTVSEGAPKMFETYKKKSSRPDSIFSGY